MSLQYLLDLAASSGGTLYLMVALLLVALTVIVERAWYLYRLMAGGRAINDSVAGMPSAGIKLSAKDGAVVVAGMVRDAQLARQAYNAIRWTPGLRSLDNRLMPAEILLFD